MRAKGRLCPPDVETAISLLIRTLCVDYSAAGNDDPDFQAYSAEIDAAVSLVQEWLAARR